jgi:pimeloyl-ACP methyl ester carboxylesterase
MARLYYGHVKTNGARIQYYRTGDEKPSVVFLHGFSDNALCWSRIAFRLEPFYDVIMVDLRGHGLSESTENGYTPEDRAADIAGLIHDLKLVKPPLVGHSMGAASAYYTAAYYPKLVGSLILEDPPFYDDPENESDEARSKRAEKFRVMISDLKGKSHADLFELGQSENPGWDKNDLFQWVKAKQQINLSAVRYIKEHREPWRFYARMVSCPVMLIHGDSEKGSIVSPKIAQELKRMWRRKLKTVFIPGAGHNIRRDQFILYLNELKSYLRKQTNW